MLAVPGTVPFEIGHNSNLRQFIWCVQLINDLYCVQDTMLWVCAIINSHTYCIRMMHELFSNRSFHSDIPKLWEAILEINSQSNKYFNIASFYFEHAQTSASFVHIVDWARCHFGLCCSNCWASASIVIIELDKRWAMRMRAYRVSLC